MRTSNLFFIRYPPAFTSAEWFRVAIFAGAAWGWAGESVAQFRPPNPGLPLFGEVSQSDALKFANAGQDDELLPFEVNGYWGLLNRSGRAIAVPEVDWTDVGIDGLARFTLDGKTGFMLGNGNWRFAPSYAYADRFEESYAVFGAGDKFGYLDKSEKVRLKPQLDAALRFREGRAGVRVGDRCGFIDTRFRPATPLRFTAVRSFHEGFAAVRLPAAEAEIATPPRGEPIDTPGLGDAPTTRPAPASPPGAQDTRPDLAAPAGDAALTTPPGGLWGFINKNGEFVFRDPTGQLEALGDFNDGLVRFQAGGRWGYMDRQFRVVVPPTYEQARDFTNGSAAVKHRGKWGYINRRYSVSVPFIYDRADDFDETLAMIALNGKVGFIDRSGRVVIEPQFDWAEPFRLGFARVGVGDSFGYVKSSGHVLYDPRQGQAGIVDITSREQLRVRASIWEQFNRTLRPPPPRPSRPAPYPPEYQYDEGLWSDPPPGSPREPSSPDTPPGGPNSDPVERV